MLAVKKDKNVARADIVGLFESLKWESARYPERLEKAIRGSHSVRTLWDGTRLVGVVTTISDGAMCVYFPYVAIAASYQGQGWGKRLMDSALEDYRGFPHVALISYGDKAIFYERCGFTIDREKIACFVKPPA